jgi:hypothetical protein
VVEQTLPGYSLMLVGLQIDIHSGVFGRKRAGKVGKGFALPLVQSGRNVMHYDILTPSVSMAAFRYRTRVGRSLIRSKRRVW